MGELCGLSWDNYRDSVTANLKTLIQDEDFVDVSLSCEGKVIKAHKLYLSAASDHFKTILKGTNIWQHPILFLSEVPFADLQKIMEFIYCGEIQIPQKKLSSFLKSAEILKINGLIDKINDVPHNTNSQSITNIKRRKRRKQSEEFIGKSNEVQNILIVGEDSIVKTEDAEDISEQVIVKADPDDFHATADDEQNLAYNYADDEYGANRGIVVRNDLINTEAVQGNYMHIF